MTWIKSTSCDIRCYFRIDLEKTNTLSKKNKALINQLPLEFDGFIQLVDAGQEYDLKFKTPTSSFKKFLGIIPQYTLQI
jgi:hypothetical protein